MTDNPSSSVPPPSKGEVPPLCLWCKHFYMDTGSQGYSDLTPGSDFNMSCGKRVWHWSVGDLFKETIRTAERCKHYKFDAERLTRD